MYLVKVEKKTTNTYPYVLSRSYKKKVMAALTDILYGLTLHPTPIRPNRDFLLRRASFTLHQHSRRRTGMIYSHLLLSLFIDVILEFKRDFLPHFKIIKAIVILQSPKPWILFTLCFLLWLVGDQRKAWEKGRRGGNLLDTLSQIDVYN